MKHSCFHEFLFQMRVKTLIFHIVLRSSIFRKFPPIDKFFSIFRGSSQISRQIDVREKLSKFREKENNAENVSKMPFYGLTNENTTTDVTTNTTARNTKNRPPLLRVSHYDEEGNSVFYLVNTTNTFIDTAA